MKGVREILEAQWQPENFPGLTSNSESEVRRYSTRFRFYFLSPSQWRNLFLSQFIFFTKLCPVSIYCGEWPSPKTCGDRLKHELSVSERIDFNSWFCHFTSYGMLGKFVWRTWLYLTVWYILRIKWDNILYSHLSMKALISYCLAQNGHLIFKNSVIFHQYFRYTK